MLRPPPRPTLFPYTTLFRSQARPTTRTPSARRGPRLMVASIPPSSTSPTTPYERDLAGCWPPSRSEEHTSELQSRRDLVCRLLLEKKKHTHSTAVHRCSPRR